MGTCFGANREQSARSAEIDAQLKKEKQKLELEVKLLLLGKKKKKNKIYNNNAWRKILY